MPAKGSGYLAPDRDQILSKELWKSFKEKHEIDIPYNQFVEVIKYSNKTIHDMVLEDETGFKLPFNLGYLVILKFKTSAKAVDWNATNKFGKRIYHLNLHTFGWRYHIKWFKTGICNFEFSKIYKMLPNRLFRVAVAKSVKQGKEYHNWSLKDFWDFNRLERLYNKKLK